MWEFPKIKVPQIIHVHTILIVFSMVNHPAIRGIPMTMEPSPDPTLIRPGALLEIMAAKPQLVDDFMGLYYPKKMGDYNNPIEESQKQPTRIQWNEIGILFPLLTCFG